MNEITVFKIRIDSVSPEHIGFEIFSGERVNDTYVNMLTNGGYAVKNRLLLTPKQFADFAIRLIAYVYIDKKIFTDKELKILWDLKLNIFDHEAQKLSNSIFINNLKQLQKLGMLLPRKGK